MFKTPTLRNVADRRVFFHNGVMHSLEQAIRFYATRDTRPELWYPTAGGRAKLHPDRSFPTYGLIATQYTGGRCRNTMTCPLRTERTSTGRCRWTAARAARSRRWARATYRI
jgi:cytochrome c peroxidase